LLSTEVTPGISAAPSSADSIVYVLKVDNQTGGSVIATQASLRLDGTHTNADVFSIDTYYNSVPDISGMPPLLDSQVAVNAPNTYTIPFSQSIPTGVSYFVFVVSIQASPTSGRTIFANGLTNPVVLTITGSPTQTNSQTNVSGTVTIS
jgi:hypothetical protein